jgi:hypothetical protein
MINPARISTTLSTKRRTAGLLNTGMKRTIEGKAAVAAPARRRRIDGLVALAMAIGVAPLQVTPIDVTAMIG